MAKKIQTKTPNQPTQTNKLLRFWGIIVASITFIGLVFTVTINGFQVWGSIFKDKNELEPQLIDFRVQPYRYKITDEDYTNAETAFTIQTSNGVYKILDSIRITDFKILENSFFDESMYFKAANVELKEVIIDRRILDLKVPDQTGIFKFKNNFFLDGKAMANMVEYPREETIAKFTIEVPYLLNGKINKLKSDVPIIVYYN